MKIGFNCLHVIPGALGGLETFIHGLLEDVGKASSADELTIFCTSRYQSEFRNYQERFTIADLDVDLQSAQKRIRFEQFKLPKIAAQYNIDILHSSGYTGPITRRFKTVMSVHDLNYIEIPQMIHRSHGLLRWMILRMLGPFAMRRADKIMTISNHVRHQITRLLNIQPERIATVHARSPGDFSKIAAQPVRLPPFCDNGFLFYVASWLPHKNHEVLFQALADAKRQGYQLPPLVLAGLHLRSDVQRSSLRQALQTHGLEKDVHCVDQHLSLENLADLYQRAKIFVFPSLFEGFGIPVVEAMSAKRPVICSRIQPLMEVIGDGALSFAPHDAAVLLSQLVTVYQNHEIRDRLANDGYERFLELQRESEMAGIKTLAIYQDVIDKR